MNRRGITNKVVPFRKCLLWGVKRRLVASMVLIFTPSALPFHAYSTTAPGAGLAHAVVTAVGKKNSTPGRLTKDDVVIYKGRERIPVTGLIPAQGDHAGLDLVILLDDALGFSVDRNLGDLRDFIRSLPTTTRVATAYMRNGSASIDQNFTSDHDQAAKSLRLPLGTLGAFSSPYLSLQDFIKRLPDVGNRREILLISDGRDRFRGWFGSYSPDLEPTVELAQRKGIVIYTIYARGIGRFTRNSFRVMTAQGGLTQLADGTGGEAFFEGTNNTPVSFKPYLEDISKMLDQQYLAMFRPETAKEDRYEHFRFTTEVPGVELIAPDGVFIPGGGKR